MYLQRPTTLIPIMHYIQLNVSTKQTTANAQV